MIFNICCPPEQRIMGICTFPLGYNTSFFAMQEQFPLLLKTTTVTVKETLKINTAATTDTPMMTGNALAAVLSELVQLHACTGQLSVVVEPVKYYNGNAHRILSLI